MLSHARVIARGRGIRDVARLVQDYGGRTRGWVKKSSPIIEIGHRRVEVHWYEHPGVGRFEEKIKWIDEA
jgi:hypothetical protein